MKKYNIFAGNYGSGKTELSLNIAINMSKEKKVILADMDTVNPYFRSAEHKELLLSHNIELIAPNFANTAVDVPSLNASLNKVFFAECAVFDVGGDPVGAKAMGGLYTKFAEVRDEVCVYYVINARRPFQSDATELSGILQQIQANVRLKIDFLINNTNLGCETKPQDLVYGQSIVEEVSKITGIPIAFASGTKDTLKGFNYQNIKTYEIDIFTRLDWLD